MSFIKYLAFIFFVGLIPTFGTDALRDSEGRPLPEKSFYTAYVTRFDQEWPVDAHGKVKKPRDLVVFHNLLEMLTTHPRALMHSNPDRYVQVLGRYLTVEQFYIVMVEGKLGKRLLEQLGVDYCVKFIASLTPDMLTDGERCTETLTSCGMEVINRIEGYIQAPVNHPENLRDIAQGDLKTYQTWYALLGVLPWMTRQEPEAHFNLSMPVIQEQVNNMVMNEFLMTVRYYERQFDFTNPQRAGDLVARYFDPRLKTPTQFFRLQGQIILMFEAAYNPFAPHYTLDQVHTIFHIIFRNYMQDNRPGEEIVNELIKGKYDLLMKSYEDIIKLQSGMANQMVSAGVDGMPIADVTANQKAQSNIHGLNALLIQSVHETLKHMWQSYLIIRQDEKNVQGYHKLQGTLDTASIIVPRLNATLAAYEKTLEGVQDL